MTNEYCHVANDRCVNPPGYRTAWGAGLNCDPPRTKRKCHRCGEVACRKCGSIRKGLFLCDICKDDSLPSRRGESDAA